MLKHGAARRDRPSLWRSVPLLNPDKDNFSRLNIAIHLIVSTPLSPFSGMSLLVLHFKLQAHPQLGDLLPQIVMGHYPLTLSNPLSSQMSLLSLLPPVHYREFYLSGGTSFDRAVLRINPQ
ncbi:hypothetical protein GOODEAATRI_025422 [Goodea atripinnis]|uniref:Uncharacterized protein n=1 Tax=Goodea atripinnis TaxID=208336 RepID=A0ABV0NQJ7_9TELE